METLGKQGLREMAWQNVQKAAYAADRLTAVRGVKKVFTGPVFNEFAVALPKPWPVVDAALKAKGLIGGYGLGPAYPELENAALVCVTEMRTKDQIDRLAQALEEVLS
jgi:glycine dehydrogenase subunit 1